MGCFVTTTRKDEKGFRCDRMAVADEVERLAGVIGWQRWGMAILYFRAGLTEEEIGRIFAVRRQTVHYQIRKALQTIVERRRRRRMCVRNRGRLRGAGANSTPDGPDI